MLQEKFERNAKGCRDLPWKKKTTIVFFLKNETHRKIQLIYLILKFFGLG